MSELLFEQTFGEAVSYSAAHSENIKKALEAYKNGGVVQFSKMDHYITIGGVVFNGINKAEFLALIKGVKKWLIT